MSDTASTRRPFQFSLWSLLVFTTVVAVLCSIGVATRWGFPFQLAAGIATLYLGFGPLSLQREPDPRMILVVAALSVRCLGVLLLSFGFMEFVGWLLRVR